MALGFQHHEGLPVKHFGKHLAAAVMNIKWSYAIFWSVSTTQQGRLTWTNGYYNGGINTRKTTQPMEFKVDQMDLQRSEQLRELYESLSAGDNNQRTKRPSASLSPEDLTDREWYYLVCMSFTFFTGQGLPGKAFTSNQHIWLSNAQFAHNKIFSRSLLAKSASIQTVVCFPFMVGVLELGTTELVLEDPAIIQHVTSSFWELPNPACSEQSISGSPMAEKNDDTTPSNLVHVLVDTLDMENHNLMVEFQKPLESSTPDFVFTFHSYTSNEEAELIQDKVKELHADLYEELKAGSPDADSSECCPTQHIVDSLSDGLHGSVNSSESISQTFVDPQMVLSSTNGESVKNYVIDYLQEGNHAKLVSLDLRGDESHFTRTLSAILRNSKQLASKPYFCSGSHESSFTVWKRGLNAPKPLTNTTPQNLLKKILMDTVWMHSGRSLQLHEGDDVGASHVLSERIRREKLNEKFLALRSLVPYISKVDKASILGDTIEYLKGLERRVEELESYQQLVELRSKGIRKNLDIAERTSDNYGSNDVSNGSKPSAIKRKAGDIEEVEAEHHWVLTKDGAIDVSVTMTDKEVLVEIHCPWRDCLMLEMVEALSNLHLDAHSLQSSTIDGVLNLTLRAKFRGYVVASPGMVKRALQRVVGKC